MAALNGQVVRVEDIEHILDALGISNEIPSRCTSITIKIPVNGAITVSYETTAQAKEIK